MSRMKIIAGFIGAALLVTMTAPVAMAQDSAKKAAAEASLYSRLGGYDAIAAVVSSFADRLVAEPKLSRSFGGFSTDRLIQFKRFNTELVCLATGGPCSYSGRPMLQVHRGSKVTGAEFEVVAGHLQATLDKFNVPKNLQGELLKIVSSLRADIVEVQ